METASTYIVKPGSSEQEAALKAFIEALKIDFKVKKKEEDYNPEFVKKIKQGEKDLREGKGTVIKTADLWK